MAGFWVVRTHCYILGYREELKTWNGKVVQKLPVSKRQVCNLSLHAGDLYPSVLSVHSSSFCVLVSAAKLINPEVHTVVSIVSILFFLLLNRALVSLNMGPSFWILTLDPVDLRTGLTSTDEDHVTGKGKPWTTPLPICPYCKP